MLDRAGVTGPDGPSHHGIWDLAMLQLVPGIRIAPPARRRAPARGVPRGHRGRGRPHRGALPQGKVNDDVEAVERLHDGVDVLSRGSSEDVLLVGIGPMVHLALEVAERLKAQGIGATVIDPRWAIPVQSPRSSSWRASTVS